MTALCPLSYADLRTEILSVLEFAPANPGPIAAGLRGWWLPASDGDLYLCARCAGRMIGRGFSLPRGADSVWVDKPEPYGVCAGCESPTNGEG